MSAPRTAFLTKGLLKNNLYKSTEIGYVLFK